MDSAPFLVTIKLMVGDRGVGDEVSILCYGTRVWTDFGLGLGLGP